MSFQYCSIFPSEKANKQTQNNNKSPMYVFYVYVYRRILYIHTEAGCKKERDRFFIMVCCDRTRGNGFKWKEGRFRLDIRKMCFTVTVVRLWHRLPGEVVVSHSWWHSDQAGWALSTGGAVDVPVHCRGLDQMAFRDSFHVRWFCDYVKSLFNWLLASHLVWSSALPSLTIQSYGETG